MTASSKNTAARTLYSRFIPREELHSFSAWTPDSLDGTDASAKSQAEEPPLTAEAAAALAAEQLREARQAGYKDGYRDGLAALENFKQSYAAQVTSQVAQLVNNFQAQLDALQQQLATSVAQLAVDIARQVVHTELATQPQLIEHVAHDALGLLVHSARHIRVRVHPEDHQLLIDRGQLDLDARHARLVPDASIHRGGCIVESDIGLIDATIETRWRHTVAALGQTCGWSRADAETPLSEHASGGPA